MYRMQVVSRLVPPPRVVAPLCRFMATTTKNPTSPPPQQLDTNKGPKPTPSQTTASKPVTNQQNTASKPAAPTAANKPAAATTANKPAATTANKPAATTAANKPATSNKSAASKPAAANQTASSKTAATKPVTTLSKADYEQARLTLPIRLYNKPGRLASRLFLLAEHSGNKGDLNKIHKGLTIFGAFLNKERRALSYFVNPTRTPDQKRKLFQKLTKKLDFPPVLGQFFEELWKRDIKFVSKMIVDFDNLVMSRNKTVNVSVTLADQKQPKPTEAQVRETLHYDKDTTVKLDFTVDPAIEGGAILRSKDRVANFSYAKIIKDFKEKLAKKDSQSLLNEKLRIMNEIKKMKDAVDI